MTTTERKSDNRSSGSPDPQSETTEFIEINQWLLSLGYSKYGSLLKNNGYDLWEILFELSKEDFMAIDVLQGHAHRIQRQLQTKKKLMAPTSSQRNSITEIPPNQNHHQYQSHYQGIHHQNIHQEHPHKLQSNNPHQPMMYNQHNNIHNVHNIHNNHNNQGIPLTPPHTQMTQLNHNSYTSHNSHHPPPMNNINNIHDIRDINNNNAHSMDKKQLLRNIHFASGIKNKLFETMTKILNGLQQELIESNGKFAKPINEMNKRITRLETMDINTTNSIWDSNDGLNCPMIKNLNQIKRYNESMWDEIKRFKELADNQINDSIKQLNHQIINNVKQQQQQQQQQPYYNQSPQKGRGRGVVVQHNIIPEHPNINNNNHTQSNNPPGQENAFLFQSLNMFLSNGLPINHHSGHHPMDMTKSTTSSTPSLPTNNVVKKESNNINLFAPIPNPSMHLHTTGYSPKKLPLRKNGLNVIKINSTKLGIRASNISFADNAINNNTKRHRRTAKEKTPTKKRKKSKSKLPYDNSPRYQKANGQKPAYTKSELKMMKDFGLKYSKCQPDNVTIKHIINLQAQMEKICKIPRSAYGIAQKMYRMQLLPATLPKKLQALQDKTNLIAQRKNNKRSSKKKRSRSIQRNNNKNSKYEESSESDHEIAATSDDLDNNNVDMLNINNNLEKERNKMKSITYRACGVEANHDQSYDNGNLSPSRRPPSTNLRRYTASEVEYIRELILNFDHKMDARELFNTFRSRFSSWDDDTESYTKFYQKKWRICREKDRIKRSINRLNNNNNDYGEESRSDSDSNSNSDGYTSEGVMDNTEPPKKKIKFNVIQNNGILQMPFNNIYTHTTMPRLTNDIDVEQHNQTPPSLNSKSNSVSSNNSNHSQNE